MLILTDRCNLKCTYCYESMCDHTMEFETAKKIIDREFEGFEDTQKGRIEFFGGEALLKFELLKKLYEYVKDQYSDKNIRYAFTTNGTLMHGPIKEWFWEHRSEFDCTLSLDGTEEMHGKNRRTRDDQNSFNKIDLEFFKTAWPGCTAKMTISAETLLDFASGIRFIESQGFYCKATFASGIDWKLKDNEAILMREMQKLVEYYRENENPLCTLLDLDLRAIFNSPDVPFRYCEAGIGKHCYDMYGRMYPCQGLASVSVGETDAVRFECEEFKDFCLSQDNPCRTCRWLRICRTCYAANYLETGSIEHNSKKVCHLNRVSILASSAVRFYRIMKKTEKTDADLMTLKAINEIQRNVMKNYGLAEK